MFTIENKAQMLAHGVSIDSVQQQLDNFVNGFKPLPVTRVASVGDGIIKIDEDIVDGLVSEYDEVIGNKSIVKFVPASGAATRMFKDLFEFLSDGKKNSTVETLLAHITDFAFYPTLKAYLGENSDSNAIVSAIVNEGLQYGEKPKGQLLFHSYDSGNRTVVEEHLVEGALYARSGDEVTIHLTVSPEHQSGFERLIESVVGKYESLYGVKYNISYSQQENSTDTIAVNLDNTPFLNADNTLLFRPSGHGALIENLNAIDADVVFIKTVDNVTTDRLKGDTIVYKKILATHLIDVQKKIFSYLNLLDNGFSSELLTEISSFVEKDLSFILPSSFSLANLDESAKYLRSILDRPIRVCGMVKNEGEPGGGPFWVKRQDGAESLQIAESSQISKEDEHLMVEATHFNPVDLVCGLRNYHGTKFDLTKFVDLSAGFISKKSKEGRDLKAQELPGLWNGAMADWNTIFIETPISTFSPAKTVIDLLRDQHK